MAIEKPRYFFWDRAGPLALPVEGARSASQRRAGPGREPMGPRGCIPLRPVLGERSVEAALKILREKTDGPPYNRPVLTGQQWGGFRTPPMGARGRAEVGGRWWRRRGWAARRAVGGGGGGEGLGAMAAAAGGVAVAVCVGLVAAREAYSAVGGLFRPTDGPRSRLAKSKRRCGVHV